MDNNASCFISALSALSPCLFTITSPDPLNAIEIVTEAQSEFVRVCFVHYLPSADVV
jgi:hypothetical protein